MQRRDSAIQIWKGCILYRALFHGSSAVCQRGEMQHRASNNQPPMHGRLYRKWILRFLLRNLCNYKLFSEFYLPEDVFYCNFLCARTGNVTLDMWVTRIILRERLRISLLDRKRDLSYVVGKIVVKKSWYLWRHLWRVVFVVISDGVFGRHL